MNLRKAESTAVAIKPACFNGKERRVFNPAIELVNNAESQHKLTVPGPDGIF